MKIAKRLLIVEDEFLIALELEAILAGAGFEIVGPAETRAVALQLIRDHTLDAAFLDYNLNGESSDDIAEALLSKCVPFAFVTGYERETVPPAFMNAPVVGKPLVAATLLEIASGLT